ncbi:MAG: transposase [Desulfotignum sp.]|nr:transposase [Desulfotignum sp.]
MARKARIHYPGAFYHVMLRGNARQTIFHDPLDVTQFEKFLTQGLERFRIRVCAFCWMPNHVHMAVQVSDVPLSKMMQVLSQRYTGWINHRYDRVGHLFQGRFRAILIDQDGYLRELVRYIHRNPVRAGIVSDPIDYQKSSHRAYVAIPKTPIAWLTTEPVLRQFGNTRESARAAYLQFMGRPEGEDLLEKLRLGGSHGHILGDDDFVDRILPRDSVPDRLDEAGVSLDELAIQVARACNVSKEGILSKSKSRPLVKARTMLAILAVDRHHFTLNAVAQYLGRNEATISRQISKNRGQALPF